MGKTVMWENMNSSVNELRRLIQQDILKESKSMFEDLIELLRKNNVIVEGNA